MPRRSLWLLGFLLLLPSSLVAQRLPIAVAIDGRAGLVTPSGDFANSSEGVDFQSGHGYAFGATLFPVRAIGLFGGLQWSRFGCQSCALVALDDSVLLSGWEAGLHLALPLGLPLSPWLRGGVVQQTLLFSGTDGAEMSSEVGTGFTAGVGVSVPIMAGLELSPAARYLSVPADFDFEAFPDRSIDVAAYSVDLGVSFRF